VVLGKDNKGVGKVNSPKNHAFVIFLDDDGAALVAQKLSPNKLSY